MSVNVPERIGKFVISSVLGQGAMGVVYKGFDPHIQRPVAIKVVHKQLLGSAGEHASIAARFRNEAQAVGRLHHPGIVAIYEFGEDENTAYIAMEYVEGRNLDETLAEQGLLPEARVCEIMEQLLDALDCAHAHGVWHRDIKPANLIVTHGGQVKLTDFGIARIENVGLTQVASTIGTPGYMAPEQYIGEGIDHRVDIFAAGVLLYRLIAGAAPFSGSPETVMYKILNEQPKPPSGVRPGGFPQVFDAVIEKAIAKAAPDRFQSAREFRAALPGRSTLIQPQTQVNTVAMPTGDETIVRPRTATGSTYPGAQAGTGPVGTAPPGSGHSSMAVRTEPLTDAFKAHATTVLTRHLGPVARIVLKRASDNAQGKAHFVELLLNAVDDADRDELRKALRTSS